MEHDSKRVAVVQLPAGQSINLVVAVGSLLNAALGGADLGAGNGNDVASTVFLKPDQPAAEAIACLRAATARLTDAPLLDLVDPDPVDEVEEPTVQQFAFDADGVTLGLRRPREDAEETAVALLDAFLPAIEALGASNYIEYAVVDPRTFDKYTMIFVKPNGLTPHQARAQAEAECARLRELIAEHGIADPLAA